MVVQDLHLLFEILKTIIKLSKLVVAVNAGTLNLGKCFKLNFAHLTFYLTQDFKPVFKVANFSLQIDLRRIL